ncbi:response regulator transcription factor [Pedobacter sp. NJ-S-72]
MSEAVKVAVFLILFYQMTKTRILLVEDDVDLAQLLSKYLVVQGHDVELALDGAIALIKLSAKQFDIAILDVMLPKEDGFSLAVALKKLYPGLPFLFLTARQQKEDVLKGLGLGADDYITKPFDADELILRVQNILRRSTLTTQPIEVLNIGCFKFEPSQLKLMSDSGSRLLTKKESGILELLAKQPGRIVPRQEILELLWDSADFFSGRSLDVYIGRLRKLLEKDHLIRLESVRGSGFILHV